MADDAVVRAIRAILRRNAQHRRAERHDGAVEDPQRTGGQTVARQADLRRGDRNSRLRRNGQLLGVVDQDDILRVIVAEESRS